MKGMLNVEHLQKIGILCLSALTPIMAYSEPPNNPLSSLLSHELSLLPKAASFNQIAGDAGAISKITLAYFSSNDCSGASAGNYTTPNGNVFPISINVPFGLVATSTWNVGNVNGISDMTTIHSVAITLKSMYTNVPQANFTGSGCGTNPSFCCAEVTCSGGPGGTCLPVSPTAAQNFTLNTTPAIGEPADGGVLACSIALGDAFNLVAASTDNSSSIEWGGQGTTTNATSTIDGANNTGTIVGILPPFPNYAAKICNDYSTTGGFSNWFLPAEQQMRCLFFNQASIPALNGPDYWTSTEFNDQLAELQQMNQDAQIAEPKNLLHNVRCVQSFTS